jgi:hypothetical protein
MRTEIFQAVMRGHFEPARPFRRAMKNKLAFVLVTPWRDCFFFVQAKEKVIMKYRLLSHS